MWYTSGGKLISIEVECGGCKKVQRYTEDSPGHCIFEGGEPCTCGPETYTCFCQTAKKIEYSCKESGCGYFGQINIY